MIDAVPTTALYDQSAERPLPITVSGRRPLLDLSALFFPQGRSLDWARNVPIFHSAAFDRAAYAVRGAIDRRDRLVVVTGPAGVGKSVLCRHIFGRMGPRTVTSLVSPAARSMEDVLCAALTHFDAWPGGSSPGDERRRITVASGFSRTSAAASAGDRADLLCEFLFAPARLQALGVLILDEADALPADLLAELDELLDRMARTGHRVFQLLLVGRPALLDTLNQRPLRPLRNRIAVQTTVGPLAAGEVSQYVRHRLPALAASHVDRGAIATSFADEALARVSRLSGGVPGAVDAICRRAMEDAHRESRTSIDGAIVDAAAAALELPPPPSFLSKLWRRRD